MLIQASLEAGGVENAIQLRRLPVLSMDPAENFGWGVPVVFSMPMSPVRLIGVIGDPTIMLDAHLFPRFGLFEVKISHSALDIERRLDIAHPRLTLGNILLRHLLWRMSFLLGAFQAIQAAVESQYSATGPGGEFETDIL